MKAGGNVMKEQWYVSLTITAVGLTALLVGGLAALEAIAARSVTRTPTASWQSSLESLDDAIERGDLFGVKERWREAHAAAVSSRQWEALIAVGDAYRRLGHATAAEREAHVEARDAYVGALLRARQTESLDGVLRAAQAFAELGDRDVVEQCLHVARGLARRAGDPEAQHRVKLFSDRWAGRTLEVERGRVAPSIAP